MSCCSTFIDLGCIDSCSTITLGDTYTQTGLHTIEMSFNNFVLKKTVSVTVGDAIVFDLSYVNEDTCVEIRIQQPDRTYIGCYRLKTKLMYSVD